MKAAPVINNYISRTSTEEKKIIIPVPYRMPGNVVKHIPVVFNVVRANNRFAITPLCTIKERRLTALPTSFEFEVIGKRIFLKKRDLLDIARDILKEIRKTES